MTIKMTLLSARPPFRTNGPGPHIPRVLKQTSRGVELTPAAPSLAGLRGSARRLLTFAAVAGFLMATLLARAGVAGATSIDNPSNNSATYTLQSAATTMVADDLNSSSSPGNTVGEWPSDGGNNQQWTIVSSQGADSGYYTIQNQASNLCLDVSGASTANNAPVIQWTCNGQDNQEWRINFTGGASNGAQPVQLVNKNSGDYLVINTPASGAGLVQSSITEYVNGANNTDWSLYRSNPATPFLITAGNPTSSSTSSSWVLEVPNSSTDWGTAVDLAQANGGDNQKWYLQAAGYSPVAIGTMSNGQPWYPIEYRVLSVYGNDWADARCLEARSANPQVGATVEQYGCDPNSINQQNQLWIVGDSDSESPLIFDSHGPVTGDVAPDYLINAALLNSTDPISGSPSLTVSSTLYPTGGSTMTLEESANNPADSQWWITPISSSNNNNNNNGGTGTSGAPCSMFACLLG